MMHSLRAEVKVVGRRLSGSTAEWSVGVDFPPQVSKTGRPLGTPSWLLWRVECGSPASFHGHGLDKLSLANAITIHKPQGSEFPVVVMPLAILQNRMLQRNLLYTAITRAKRLLVTAGERRALETAIANSKSSQRFGAHEAVEDGVNVQPEHMAGPPPHGWLLEPFLSATIMPGTIRAEPDTIAQICVAA
jgi:hypothetical protein